MSPNCVVVNCPPSQDPEVPQEVVAEWVVAHPHGSVRSPPSPLPPTPTPTLPSRAPSPGPAVRVQAPVVLKHCEPGPGRRGRPLALAARRRDGDVRRLQPEVPSTPAHTPFRARGGKGAAVQPAPERASRSGGAHVRGEAFGAHSGPEPGLLPRNPRGLGGEGGAGEEPLHVGERGRRRGHGCIAADAAKSSADLLLLLRLLGACLGGSCVVGKKERQTGV
jgi:hypothetical protein